MIDISQVLLTTHLATQYLLYTSLGSGVVADAFIAVSMCVLLSQSRTGVRNTDSVIDTLMMYTINTSACIRLSQAQIAHSAYNRRPAHDVRVVKSSVA